MSPRIAKLLFALLLILAIGASVYRPASLPRLGSGGVGHFAVYAMLQLSGGIAFPRAGGIWKVAICLVLVGASLELAQYFIRARHASWVDFTADVAGVVAGISILTLTQLARRRPGVHVRLHPDPADAFPSPAAAGADKKRSPFKA